MACVTHPTLLSFQLSVELLDYMDEILALQLAGMLYIPTALIVPIGYKKLQSFLSFLFSVWVFGYVALEFND